MQAFFEKFFGGVLEAPPFDCALLENVNVINVTASVDVKHFVVFIRDNAKIAPVKLAHQLGSHSNCILRLALKVVKAHHRTFFVGAILDFVLHFGISFLFVFPFVDISIYLLKNKCK